MNTLSRVTAATALGAGLLLVPTAAATAAPAVPSTIALAEDAASGCAVTGGSLTWGVKESFRSYISGTIANGSWEVSDGATYETPSFGWSNPTGEFDPETGVGNVSFTGTITFTGHGGILNMVLANPTIQFAEDGSARLLLDTKSNDTSGALVVDQTQAELASIATNGPVDPASGSYVLTDAPVTLTEAGVPAFGDFYAAGDALDPITLAVEFGPCATEEVVVEEEAAVEEEDLTPISAPIEEDEGSVPWIPIAIGAAVVVMGAAVWFAVASKRKKNAENAENAENGDGSTPAAAPDREAPADGPADSGADGSH